MEQRTPRASRLAREAEDPLRRADHLLGDLDDPQLIAHAILDGPYEQVPPAWLGGRLPRAGGLGRRRLGGRVAEEARQLHGGDAVDHAVVRLADHADPPVGELVGDPDLPQRTVTVERRRVHVLDEPAEVARGGAAHVVADVERGVVDPLRVVQAERHPGKLLPVAGRERHPALDAPAQLPEARSLRAFRWPEERHPPDVHVSGGGLHLQERRIERRKSHAAAVRSRRWHLSTPSGSGNTATSHGPTSNPATHRFEVHYLATCVGNLLIRPPGSDEAVCRASERRTGYGLDASGPSARSRSAAGSASSSASARARIIVQRLAPHAPAGPHGGHQQRLPGQLLGCRGDHVALHLARPRSGGRPASAREGWPCRGKS